MNEIDKKWYKTLKFLSKMSVDEAFGEVKKKYPQKYKEYIEGETWNMLHKFGHVFSSIDSPQLVTPSGLQQLRELEDVRKKRFDFNCLRGCNYYFYSCFNNFNRFPILYSWCKRLSVCV